MNETRQVVNPVAIVIKQDDGQMVTHLHPPQGWTHKHYGLIAADLVRHAANAFGVDEDAVWEWVDKERYHKTTKITKAS